MLLGRCIPINSGVRTLKVVTASEHEERSIQIRWQVKLVKRYQAIRLP